MATRRSLEADLFELAGARMLMLLPQLLSLLPSATSRATL